LQKELKNDDRKINKLRITGLLINWVLDYSYATQIN